MALRALAGRFRAAGLDTPALDARLLLMHAAGLSLEAVLTAPERVLGAAEAERLEALARRRLEGEPVARLLGTKEFWGLEFRLSPATLVPRPETESLVAAALDWADGRGLRQAPLRIADLGTGTGCVLTALLTELGRARGVGVDLSEDACRTARRNLARHGLLGRALTVRGDWTAPLAPGFDLIVSNPPYVRNPDLEGLPAEVRGFDPPLALDGGPDGLAAYRVLIPAAFSSLRPGGFLAVEVGQGQAGDVVRLAELSGFAPTEVRADLASVQRIVAACRPDAE